MSKLHSRRNFLGSMLGLTGAAVTPFTLNLAAIGAAAAAEATDDYKALVCLYMNGGNDGANTVLATDPSSWATYNKARLTLDGGSIALSAPGTSGGVLPITPTTTQAGRSFALHPSLAPLKQLFDNGRAAIVANVGTLVQPTTKAQYMAGTVALPPKLFSHNDQQAVWQSSNPEGAASGWGGRMGDLLAASNSNANFTCVSAGGNALFLSGRSVNQYQISSSGVVPVRNLDADLFGVTPSANPLRAIVTGNNGNMIANEHAAVVRRALSAQSTLGSTMLPAGAGGIPDPTPYINPNTKAAAVNPLAVQLQTIARVIGGRSALGAKRQVFYVSIGGFDAHDNQKTQQADLLARVAHAVAYFDTLMASMQGTDMRKQVTLFTASDFGRTFSSNGDGTDHGWGSHHFVIGGAVKGKDIYGAFPATSLGHELDIGAGALLPTTSVDQYGATLATWLGVSAGQLQSVFPNILNFTNRNLGFMA